MKKITIFFFFSVIILFGAWGKVFADEASEGRDLWQKLSAQELKCADISDQQFENLGEFFMERMAGSPAAHEAMNQRMEQMMGKEATDQMHIALGKRLSGCDLRAEAPGSWGPMMGMMFSGFGQKGGGKTMMGPGMMGWYGGNGLVGMMGGSGAFWIWSILSWATWILIIVALIAFIRWMWKKGDRK